VRIGGIRWPIEIIFEEDKGEIGLEPYETCSWRGGHHHRLLVTLLHHYLAWLRIRFHEESPASKLNHTPPFIFEGRRIALPGIVDAW
jgi:SRSO17 transposase